MKDIKILEKKSTYVDLDTMDDEQRYLVIDSIATLPKLYRESIYNLQTDVIRFNELCTQPQIPELLLRRIVEVAREIKKLKTNNLFSENILALERTGVLPIVEEVKSSTPVMTRGGDTHGGAAAIARRRHPGVVERSADMFAKAATNSSNKGVNSITTRFDLSTRCETPSGITYIAVGDIEIKIIGIMLSELCPRTYNQKVLFNNSLYSHKTLSARCIGVVNTPEDKVMFESLSNDGIVKELTRIYNQYTGLLKFFMSMNAAAIIFARPNPQPKFKPFVLKTTPMTPPSEQIKQISSSIKFPINTTYDISAAYTLYSMGAYDILAHARVEGVDAQSTRDMIDMHNHIRAVGVVKKEITRKSLQAKYISNLILLIINETLGADAERQAEKYIANNPTVQGTDITKAFNEKDRARVLTAFEMRKNYYKSFTTNDCPHVKIYKAIRASKTDIEKYRHLQSLQRFIAAEPKRKKKTVGLVLDNTRMHKCSNCKFDLICPHIIETIELAHKNTPFNVARARLSKYISNENNGNYYCGICQEVISRADQYGESHANDISVYSRIPEDLRTMMWSEVSGAVRNTTFSSLINVSKLIMSIIGGIYDFVFEIEKQLMKSKTNSANDIKNKKKLFIVIYAYAYLINLINSNKKKHGESVIEFKQMHRTLKKNPKATLGLADYVKYAIVTIINTKNAIISQITNITNDFIRNKVIDAYKNVAMEGPQIVYLSDQPEDIYNILVLDPIYYYYYYINMLDKSIAKKRTTDMFDKIRYIMNADVDKLNTHPDGVYGKVRLPKLQLPQWHLAEFNNLKAVGRGDIYRKNAATFYDDAVIGYIAASFQNFRTRHSLRLHTEHVFETDGSYNPRVAKFHTECDELLVKENIFMQHKAMRYIKNTASFITGNTRNFEYVKAPFGSAYDEQGRPHKFDIFVYGKKEYTIDELRAAIDNGSSKSSLGKLSNRKCSTCGIKISEVGTLSEKKIVNMLNEQSFVENFFRFYINRCPVDILHQWEDNKTDSQCAHCGLKFSSLNDIYGASATAYLKKYRNRFNEQSEDTLGDRVIHHPVDMEKALRVYDSEYTKYMYDFNHALKLSTLLKVNSNIISSLAATENVEYKDVISGKYISPIPDIRDDSRIYMLDHYIQMVTIEYNMMKNYGSLVKPSTALTDIIVKGGIKRHEYAALPKALQSIPIDFNAKMEYFRRYKKPMEIIEFAIESFSRLCLWIVEYKDTTKLNTRELRKRFVMYITKKIFRIDELQTKHGEINWKMFRKEKERETADEEKASYDPNTDNDYGLATEESIEEGKKENDEYGSTNEVMQNNFDMDVDEEDNEMNVDDSGMSGI